VEVVSSFPWASSPDVLSHPTSDPINQRTAGRHSFRVPKREDRGGNSKHSTPMGDEGAMQGSSRHGERTFPTYGKPLRQLWKSKAAKFSHLWIQRT
jgi:hypothetical protein